MGFGIARFESNFVDCPFDTCLGKYSQGLEIKLHLLRNGKCPQVESLLGDSLVILHHDMPIKKSVCTVFICLQAIVVIAIWLEIHNGTPFKRPGTSPINNFQDFCIQCFSTQWSYIDRQAKVADPRDKECVLIMV